MDAPAATASAAPLAADSGPAAASPLPFALPLPAAPPTAEALSHVTTWTQLLAAAGLHGAAAVAFLAALEIEETDAFAHLAEALETSFWADLKADWKWTVTSDGSEKAVRPKTKSLGQAGVARRFAILLATRMAGFDKAPAGPRVTDARPAPASQAPPGDVYTSP